MAITLASAKLNTTDAVDMQVIDEFRKSSWLLDNMTFDNAVSPAGGGATLTYGYTRLTTERPAAFRQYGAEYTDAEAVRTRYTVDLAPLGGSFKVDRVLAKLGPAASTEVAFQMGQTIKSARTFFSDQVINGVRVTTPGAEQGFDGLDKALTGSTTEYLPLNNGVTAGYVDWTGATLAADAVKINAALDMLDEFLGTLDGTPSGIVGNKKVLSIIRSLGRRAGYYDRTLNGFGQPVETYNGIPLVNLGDKAGASTPIVPIAARDADGAGAGGSITGLTDLYAVRLGLDGFHGVSTVGGNLVSQWLPDFTTAGAAKRGEVELGPVAVALKATKAAGVLRNIKVQ